MQHRAAKASAPERLRKRLEEETLKEAQRVRTEKKHARAWDPSIQAGNMIMRPVRVPPCVPLHALSLTPSTRLSCYLLCTQFIALGPSDPSLLRPPGTRFDGTRPKVPWCVAVVHGGVALRVCVCVTRTYTERVSCPGSRYLKARSLATRQYQRAGAATPLAICVGDAATTAAAPKASGNPSVLEPKPMTKSPSTVAHERGSRTTRCLGVIWWAPVAARPRLLAAANARAAAAQRAPFARTVAARCPPQRLNALYVRVCKHVCMRARARARARVCVCVCVCVCVVWLCVSGDSPLSHRVVSLPTAAFVEGSRRREPCLFYACVQPTTDRTRYVHSLPLPSRGVGC